MCGENINNEDGIWKKCFYIFSVLNELLYCRYNVFVWRNDFFLSILCGTEAADGFLVVKIDVFYEVYDDINLSYTFPWNFLLYLISVDVKSHTVTRTLLLTFYSKSESYEFWHLFLKNLKKEIQQKNRKISKQMIILKKKSMEWNT